jgi:hypothetical protein
MLAQSMVPFHAAHKLHYDRITPDSSKLYLDVCQALCGNLIYPLSRYNQYHCLGSVFG